MGLDLAALGRLTFRKPDTRRFPCLELGRAALEKGGAMPCVLNAADEVAVESFLTRRLPFGDIPRVIERVMRRMPETELRSLDDVLKCDREARQLARELIPRTS